MNNWRSITKRLLSSSVAWSWAFNAIRLVSGLLLIPLLLRYLTKEEMGMYYVFLSLSALGPLMDLGFLNAIDRSVGYAMAGVKELKAHGAVRTEEAASGPNFGLLWKLLHTTQALYRVFALVLCLVLFAWGAYVVSLGLQKAPLLSPRMTWLAFGVTLAGTTLELYSSWWGVFLRGMNQVLASTRILVVVYLIRIVLSCALLLAGGKLLSIPVAGFLTSLLMRYWTRRGCLEFLAVQPSPPPTRTELFTLLRILWPNSWRIGVQFFSGYLTTNANTFICLKVFGPAANAQYGLTIQVLNILSIMAGVWVSVKWPIMSQYRARQDGSSLRKTFWPRLWLFKLSFLLMATVAVLTLPYLLPWLGTNKSMLPQPWLTLTAVYIFFEGQLTIWATLIITENRLPFLWPFVATNFFSLGLVLTLLHFTHLGLGCLILGPLIAGSLLNYWYWPIEGARTLQTTWRRFLFARPA